MRKYFSGSLMSLILGVFLGAGLAFLKTPTWIAALEGAFLIGVLSLLEISISFDNAIVNATVLKTMPPIWQHRFLTWGMAIAVFGMRLLFPLIIVAVLAHIGPIEALRLAAFEPVKYSEMMLSIHHEVAAFGGSFLLLVALEYFIDHEKNEHWIKPIEKPLGLMGHIEAIEIAITLLTIMIFAKFQPPENALSFVYAGLAGVLTFIAVEAVGTILQSSKWGAQKSASTAADLARQGLASFIYLEVLDSSFSFDGVVGAFAISNNLFLIAIGLGVGAMFVRSLTILMVDKGTLDTFKYLEHGAFYAVASLAMLMLANTLTDIPEYITAIVGALFIAVSFYSSIQEQKSIEKTKS